MVVGSIISQRPSVRHLLPNASTVPFFVMEILFLVRFTSQLSSRSCPSESKDVLFNPGSTCAVDASFDKPGMGTVPFFVARRIDISGSATTGPGVTLIYFLVCVHLVHG